VYQQLWPYSEEYRHLGLYHLSADPPATNDCYIEHDGARIVLGNEAQAQLVRVDAAATENRLPSPSPEEEEEEEKQKEFNLPSPPPSTPPVHSSVNLPPTPPPADDDDDDDLTTVPAEFLLRHEVDRDDEEYHTKTPTAESYADLGCASSMSESTYSNISADGADDDESDRWSVLSTGPVDRQWTVVFDEKEETV
jgi:hypothetical protein